MVHSAEESEYKQYANQSKSISRIYSDDILRELSYVFSDRNKSDGKQRSILINKSKPLVRYSVLYLGAAIPSEDQRGIDAIQEPLSQRYPVDGKETVHGIETWLSIDENGLQIQFVSDPSVVLYYPIRSLIYCAGVRFAKQTRTNDEFPNDWRFVSLDSPEANLIENTQNPPIFTVTFRRTRDSSIDECHSFVAKAKHTALGLVEACYNAYHGTGSGQDCAKVPLYFKVDDNGSKIQELDNEIYIVPASAHEHASDDQRSEDNSGFFYKTDYVRIDCWQLWEHQKNGTHRTSSNYSSSSRSSRSSNRRPNQRHLASLTPVPDAQKVPLRSEFQSTNNSTNQLPLDPYTPVPNVFRVERIKDKNSGRDVYVRWLHDKPQIPKQIPLSETPTYDFHVDSTTDNQTEKILSKETKRLALNNEHSKKSVRLQDKPQIITTHHERKKSKKRHRKDKHRDSQVVGEFNDDRRGKSRSNKTHRHKKSEVSNLPSPTLIEQQFPTHSLMEKQLPIHTFMTNQFPMSPSTTAFPMRTGSYTFHTIEPYSQSNNTNPSSAFWYYTM